MLRVGLSDSSTLRAFISEGWIRAGDGLHAVITKNSNVDEETPLHLRFRRVPGKIVSYDARGVPALRVCRGGLDRRLSIPRRIAAGNVQGEAGRDSGLVACGSAGRGRGL